LFEKKKQKNFFNLGAAAETHAAKVIEFFCFFFSKKAGLYFPISPVINASPAGEPNPVTKSNDGVHENFPLLPLTSS